MTLSQELPHSFEGALALARKILLRSKTLVERNLVETESEQIVQAAFQWVTQKKLSRADLLMRVKDPFPLSAAEKVLVWSTQRADGKPLQYLTGTQAFLDHEYFVGPGVLVPRPETEFLVTLAMQELGSIAPRYGIEVGLGSGAISIELLSRFSALEMVASEIEPAASEIAERNAVAILGSSGAKRLQVVQPSGAADVLGAFNKKGADFIISNPPYLDPLDPIDEDVLRYEPKSALFPAGADSLYFYKEFARYSKDWLKPGCWIFLEIPHQRAQVILSLFDQTVWQLRLSQDLTGRDRVLVGKLDPKSST